MTTRMRREGRPLPVVVERLADRASAGVPDIGGDSRGAAMAATVEGFAAVVWFGWAQVSADGWLSTLLTLGGVAAFAVAIVGFVRAAQGRRSGSPLRIDWIRKRYVTVLAVEAVVLVLGLVLLALTRSLGWSPAWVGLVFGLHAVPLGRVLGDRMLEVVGLVVVAVSVVALLVAVTGGVGLATLTGTAGGICLLVAGLGSIFPRVRSRLAF